MQAECGRFWLTDNGSDRLLMEVATTQCAHCHRHFPHPKFEAVFIKGMVALVGYEFTAEAKLSRIGRGWCPNHGPNGYVCSAECADCIDREKKLEILEGRRNPTTVSAAVPASPLWLPPIYAK